VPLIEGEEKGTNKTKEGKKNSYPRGTNKTNYLINYTGGENGKRSKDFFTTFPQF
jgi:hypothetical protein